MIKPSAAPDYIYHAAMVRNLLVVGLAVGGPYFFISTQLPFSFDQKNIFLSVKARHPLRIVMTRALADLKLSLSAAIWAERCLETGVVA